MSEKETTVVNLPASTVTGNGSPKPAYTDGNKATPYQTVVPTRKSANIEKAKIILRGGQADPQTILALAKTLKEENRFTYARRLLLRASKHKDTTSNKSLRLKIYQQLALCTYKDEDLPADERLDRALEILQEIADFDETKDQETLGLIAAVYKRKWEVDDQRQNLERSLQFYMRGYEQGCEGDQGYNGINAAFILDRLAYLEEGEAGKAGRESLIAAGRRKRAREIREDIVKRVGAMVTDPTHKWVTTKWWYYATMAEACFGLQCYDDAVEWIRKGHAAADKVYEWELETLARQLASLARLQSPENLQPARAALLKAFNNVEAVTRTAFAGKVGLALSGGGFRASLYHLGVLAQLAELDVLRNVEVLSCVSGGAIVGAYYYLKVRHLLQTKTDAEITRQHYIDIVREMIDEFVAGVQKNIRTRVAVNPLKNFRMLATPNYSRTVRAAELYEQYLYALVQDDHELKKDRYLNDLTIAPLVQNGAETERDTSFSPKYQNWRRSAKVPILVLNAATLNTGHTWQFTASWMGEAPAGIDTDIDGNDRLRRMYYNEAPEGHQRIRLGQAVGASAAVPGVFEPLTMDNLFPDRIVRLADGGVCDNQGVGTLLEQDCKVVLVSDASGQMESQAASSRQIFGVLLRTNDIFQARIREAEYQDLKGRRRSNLLRGFMFVHLKGDLDVDPVDWIDCLDPYDPFEDVRPLWRHDRYTRYGIAKDVQKLLSAIRTDLDSFSEAEAYALMTSGFRMTEFQFKQGNCVEEFFLPAENEKWKFLEIEEFMRGSGKGNQYLKTLLGAGNSLAFKVWQIDPVLKNIGRVVLALIALALAWLIFKWWNTPLPTDALADYLQMRANSLRNITFKRLADYVVAIASTTVIFMILGKVLTTLFGTFVSENAIRLIRWRDNVRKVAIAIFISTVGWVLACTHLYIFDKRFLALSTLEKVKQKNG
ncbi:MAG TPA: tetratricopeptide repeat-containing protein [Pyrinomonadaceae bacterium]|nr:tetratricopeptide repeat-containing protein [Pyrinomonadaceae bacterium]